MGLPCQESGMPSTGLIYIFRRGSCGNRLREKQMMARTLPLHAISSDKGIA